MDSFKFLPLVSLLCFGQVNAAIISYGSYSHDDTTDIVVGDGLEWLQWDHDDVLGRSWNEIRNNLDLIEGGGWSLATNSQMASLYNNFDFGFNFDANSLETQLAITGIQTDGQSSDPWENDVSFINMFGDTKGETDPNIILGAMYTSALYGELLGPDGQPAIGMAVVFDDDYRVTSDIQIPGRAWLHHDQWINSSNANGPELGIALVRSISVPEPSILGLMAAGLVGLGITCRRRKQS